MKQVKSKITGDIGELDFNSKEGIFIVVCYYLNTKETVKSYYKSLEDLCVEWEDYEELPKGYWVIEPYGKVEYIKLDRHWSEDLYYQFKNFGNYFETKEEAERAVEKLKAWKRLKDKGFRFEKWRRDPRYCGDYLIRAYDDITSNDEDLDLLFGGE